MREGDYGTIVYVEGPISRITLDRPEKRNALSKALILEIQDALARSKREPATTCVVIDATGPDFCAGHDLVAHAEIVGKHRPWHEEDARAYLEFLRDSWYYPLLDYPKPLIAAVHGRSNTGGVEFAMLCDITIASEDVQFSFDVLRVTGVSPGLMLPWIVGYKKAFELYLTGGSVNAAEALRLNMVNRVVPRDRLLPEAMRMATIISRIPAEVSKLNKMATRHAFNLMGIRSSMFYAHEADILAHLRAGDEVESEMRFSQGVRSAVQWRRERFKDVDEP